MVIPDGVITIGSSAFYGCSNIKTLVIGKNVESYDGMISLNLTSIHALFWRILSLETR